MSDNDEASGPAKPTRMPTGVRLKLAQAVSAHLRVHGNRNYDLLREDPEFSAYIGRQLGETGDKRLDRIVARVKASSREPKPRGGRGSKIEALSPPAPEADAPRPTAQLATVEVLAGIRPVAVGHDQLQQLLEVCLHKLNNAMSACCGRDGNPLDSALFIKLLRELRATIETITRLTERYQGQLNTARFTTGVLEILRRECADKERFQEVGKEIRELIARCGGLAPSDGGEE